MKTEFKEYIEEVLGKIQADRDIKKKIRQSLTEHIEVMIEKHGSSAYHHLQSTEDVANEFMDNLGIKKDLRVMEYPAYPWWIKRNTYRKISKTKIFNMPLYHITDGYNPDTGKFEIAKGFIAIGPIAFGVISCGGIAVGIISFGAISLGLLVALGGLAGALGIAVGGLALGGLLANGGMALSYGIAFGGYASGHVAIGGIVNGEYTYNTRTCQGNAIEWFKQYMPYFTKYFN